MSETVSVIVATYKRKESLIRALDSLARQTYTDIEILLIDDNATKEWNDIVAGIVEKFLNENESISLTYIQNESNLGSAESRNRGIQKAKGTYVTFLDDDDVYLPNKIGNQVAFMEQNGLDYSVTDLDLYYDDGKLCEQKRREFLLQVEPQRLFELHLKYHITGTDTMMFLKTYINKIGGFAPIDVGDEFYLMQRAIKASGKFGYLPQCDVIAYVHKTQEGLSSGAKKIEGEKRLYQYKKQYFSQLKVRVRRYIRMRHYAVLAFAYLRMGCYFQFFTLGIKSFFCSPFACCKLLIKGK